jgi:hypothetical protein
MAVRVPRFAKGIIVRNRSVSRACASARAWTAGVAVCLLGLTCVPAARAQATPTVTFGGGIRTSFTHLDVDTGEASDRFALDNARLYVNGTVTSNIKVMFNTDYSSISDDLQVLDAVGRFEFSKAFNVWVGRFLPPSDRANLYGPFYAHHWGVYSDGIQDGYPFVYQGRDNGAMYWGQFGKVKLSGGIFDGLSASGQDTVISAGRVQVDLWDPEDGYYLNGSYYGDKNLLAIGLAGQVQPGKNDGDDTRKAVSADFLLERKVGMGGAYTVEAEWARYNQLGGYNPRYNVDDGAYILGSYLFPAKAGVGRFEPLVKYAYARFREGLSKGDLDYNQKTTELNLNYIIKQFDARVMIFYKDTRFDAVLPNFWQMGVGLQLQM